MMEYDDELNDLYLNDDDYLEHYGIKRRSGRYPWGSGDQPFQRSGDFLARIDELKKQGLSETQRAEALGVSTTKLRTLESIAKAELKSDLRDRALSLQKDGLNRVQIAAELGLKGESSVRSLLNEDSIARTKIAEQTAEYLKEVVDQKGMVDVGVGVNRELSINQKLGISPQKMEQALEILKLEGYHVYGGGVPQATNKGKYTNLKVLAVPGTEHKDIYQYDKIGTVTDYISRDGGKTFEPKFVYPKSLNSDRLAIRYAEDGGSEKDGVVEIRRGVKDLSLGNSNYSQVRILVDDTHYIKGMAIYSDNLPDGVDILFNTNKSNNLSKIEVLKKIKDDPDNPFGSYIKEHGGQSHYTDDNGEKQLSLINKRSDEGDWGDWSKELSSQFLSKQPMKLINQQLNISMMNNQDEFNEIMSLTNPTVKRELLKSFSDDLDSASVHLKAASLPGVKYKVILPIGSLKDNETYAPDLEDGSQVALVRYPHGGTFEIPILTVNNRNREAQSVLTKNPADAIGINSRVAAILSGADFDGDTVMVIPLNDKTKIKSDMPFESFDPVMSYGPDQPPVIIKGIEVYSRGGKKYKTMDESNVQNQMGQISNLITDMTLKGANREELNRAVKHSMVVIDAHKHNLDYKQSEIDNGIRALKENYQKQVDKYGREHGGAATLISKSKSEVDVPERKEGAFFAVDTGNRLTLVNTDDGKKLYFDDVTKKVYTEKEKRTLTIDPKTGEKLWHETNREFKTTKYRNSEGKLVKASVMEKDGKLLYKDESGEYLPVTEHQVVITKPAMVKSTKMEEAKDARELSSGTPQEEAYATYSNKLKSMANDARKEMLIIKDIPYSRTAKDTYGDEVTSLNYKLNQALLNPPKERHAQTIAASIIKAKKQSNPTMTDEQFKKLSQQELIRARQKVGAKRADIKLTPKEWEAIQAGAISASRLKEILRVSDLDVLRQLAMPRNQTVLSDSKIRRIKNMAMSGYTTSEIARTLGVSTSTVNNYLKPKGDV